MQLKASCPHLKTWAQSSFPILRLSSIILAQWSSSLSVVYLLIQEIFKDLKKFRTSLKLKPPSAFEPYSIYWCIQFLATEDNVDPVLTKLRIYLLICFYVPSLGSSTEAMYTN